MNRGICRYFSGEDCCPEVSLEAASETWLAAPLSAMTGPDGFLDSAFSLGIFCGELPLRIFIVDA